MVEIIYTSYTLVPLVGFLMYFLIVLSTFIHEKTHQIKFSKYGIKAIIVLDWLGGKCQPINKEEDSKSNSLSVDAQREIIMAGTKVDLFFIGIILIILAILSTVFYYFSKENFNNLHLILFFQLAFFGFLIIKLFGIYKNFFHIGRGRIKGDLSELIYQITKNK